MFILLISITRLKNGILYDVRTCILTIMIYMFPFLICAKSSKQIYSIMMYVKKSNTFILNKRKKDIECYKSVITSGFWRTSITT